MNICFTLHPTPSCVQHVTLHHSPLAGRPGHPCPNCAGFGTVGDSMRVSADGSCEYRRGPNCGLCAGKGRVKVTAFTDEEYKP